MEYNVDIRDLKFQLFDWLETDQLLAAERFADWDAENVEMVIDEALRIAQHELAPTNEDGDRTGAKWDAGEVTVPESFKPAYETLCQGGWIGCTANPELGGLGLPEVVGTAVAELFAGANLSLSLANLLTKGAGQLIEDFGGEELKALLCEKLYTGRWGGTMCLTEPQAGSDVGAATSRAVRQEDGSYLISGEKIYITFGEHDLTDNIVHTVLARTPEAPAGTRGLSLFAVPKIRVGEGGVLGEDNDVYCASIEHKLGIHGSPTCSIVFGQNDACQGFLLGQEGEGMRLMFQMMNAARIEVGVQAAAVAGAAQQAALKYARERLQMRHWSGRKGHGQVPIVEHPDVRRLLLSSSAYVQAMRSLLLKASYCHDMSRVSEGEEAERYHALLEVLTPICKAWPSDWGFRVTEWCLQVFGGYGYTKDYPAEQYLRDAKITSIYEGTNGIQALDFVGRKLRIRGGEIVRELLAAATDTAGRLAGDQQLGRSAGLLGRAVSELGEILQQIPGRDDGPLTLVLNAVPVTDSFGTVLGAQHLLEQAVVARRRLDAVLAEKGVEAGGEAYRELLAGNQDAAFYHNKIQSAVHFCYRALPSVTAHAVAIRDGERAAMDAVL